MLRFLSSYLPEGPAMTGRYIEPFVGGAAVFLFVGPNSAVLSDSNKDLIGLYEAIRANPAAVWKLYESYGETKADYVHVRSWKTADLSETERAARLLFLNRTCFKGNWRHNSDGEFNVGYGGQSRRWVISERLLFDVAQALSQAELCCRDFEETLLDAVEGDFLFLDPPYKPGARQLQNSHYGWNQFKFEDHQRLAANLIAATARGINWCMTTSSHPDIVGLFSQARVIRVPSRRRGRQDSGEVLVVSQRRQQ